MTRRDDQFLGQHIERDHGAEHLRRPLGLILRIVDVIEPLLPAQGKLPRPVRVSRARQVRGLHGIQGLPRKQPGLLRELVSVDIRQLPPNHGHGQQIGRIRQVI